MIDADRLDRVIGPGRRGTEGAAGNFLGFIERVPLGDGFGNVDREKRRLAPVPGPPLARAVAVMASAVILLSSGPTVMNASMVGSRTISAIWVVLNWVTGTL